MDVLPFFWIIHLNLFFHERETRMSFSLEISSNICLVVDINSFLLRITSPASFVFKYTEKKK
jgi:hypothetical protein